MKEDLPKCDEFKDFRDDFREGEDKIMRGNDTKNSSII